MSAIEMLTRLRDSLQLTEQDRQNRQRLIENLDPAERAMLILVRKVQQSIWIGGGINIQVLSIERDRVKLGITAPNDVRVMRQELMLEGQDPRDLERETIPQKDEQK